MLYICCTMYNKYITMSTETIKKQTASILLLFCMFAVTAQTPTNNSTETAEDVVNRQLDAYNARNIDEFVATYSEDIEIYNSKGELTMKGHKQLRERYNSLFKKTPNLHCRIENRIKINNKVIDKENVTMNERIVEAVAIYEVTDGKIQKVTFVD